MHRLLFLLLLFVSAGLSGPAAAQTGSAQGLPPRPTPFRFVNDQAQLMAPADVKKLENGLRRYADNNGTQIVVVTVPTLGGREVADYGRALGTAWGIGQRDKNNGLVVLLSGQEHKLTIQPGSGLKDQITPEVTSRAIAVMTPSFKQGNYFAGLRAGLNLLMKAANPASVSQATTTPAAAGATAAGAADGTVAGANNNLNGQAETPTATTPNDPMLTPPATEPNSGPGMGTVLLGALVVGGILWLLVRMFRRRSQPTAGMNTGNANAGSAPDFLPNRNGPNNMQRGGSNFGGGGGGNFGGGMGGMGGGSGMGGILATGAAAAAGAYLGNRMASGHEAPTSGLTGDGTAPHHFDPNTAAGAAGAGAAGTGAADDYFSGRDGNTDNSTPDYFSDDATADNSSGDFFSSDDSDNSSYDDPSSGDFGGGGFDSGSDNSGSW